MYGNFEGKSSSARRQGTCETKAADGAIQASRAFAILSRDIHINLCNMKLALQALEAY